MKSIRKFLLSMSALGMVAAPAQAQTWTDRSGLSLGWYGITFAGSLNISIFGSLSNICNVSIDGQVISSDTILFTGITPGFVSNCDPSTFGEIEFPFELKARFSPHSPPIEYAVATDFTFMTPFGPCSISEVPFFWNDHLVSTATLQWNVPAGVCTIKSGSYLNPASAHADAVEIR
jgi:hypothetical protein